MYDNYRCLRIPFEFLFVAIPSSFIILYLLLELLFLSSVGYPLLRQCTYRLKYPLTMDQ